MALKLILGLYVLVANPKSGVSSSTTSLIIFHKALGTTQQTSSPQLLPCQAEAEKIHLKVIISFLELRGIIGVI